MCIDVCMCCVDVHVSVYMYFTNTYSNMYTQRHTHAHTHATPFRYFDEKRGKEALEALKGQASATTGLAQLQVCMSVCICTYVCMYVCMYVFANLTCHSLKCSIPTVERYINQ